MVIWKEYSIRVPLVNENPRLWYLTRFFTRYKFVTYLLTYLLSSCWCDEQVKSRGLQCRETLGARRDIIYTSAWETLRQFLPHGAIGPIRRVLFCRSVTVRLFVCLSVCLSALIRLVTTHIQYLCGNGTYRSPSICSLRLISDRWINNDLKKPK